MLSMAERQLGTEKKAKRPKESYAYNDTYTGLMVSLHN